MVEAKQLDGQPVEPETASLSYKFQRLREKLRAAVTSGELTGKLPGERALARRFHVNAKTLSKALTDLAAEGLLDRHIGRGTFVKGTGPEALGQKRWLLICEPDQACWEIVSLLRNAQPDLEILTDTSAVRPSFLNQFGAVIDLSPSTPDSFIRDLVVRNISVVVVGKEPKTYSTHAVTFDGPLAVSMLARDLMINGHHKLAAVEPAQCTVVAVALRQAAARYAPHATVEACFPQDVATMVEHGITAFVCQNVDLASQVKKQLEKSGVAIPDRVSVVAVGSTSHDQPVTGYFMPRLEKANAIVSLLTQPTSRPTTIWLAGQFVDRGTLAPVHGSPGDLVTGSQSHRQSEAAA
jgi:hypothetical protein